MKSGKKSEDKATLWSVINCGVEIGILIGMGLAFLLTGLMLIVRNITYLGASFLGIVVLICGIVMYIYIRMFSHLDVEVINSFSSNQEDKEVTGK